MSAHAASPKAEITEFPLEEAYTGHVVERLSTSRRFFKGISRHMQAVRRMRMLEAQNSELLAANQLLLYENTHDDLTGLLNKKVLKFQIAERTKLNRPFGLLFMDMDAFKAVNDHFGHESGDVLLGRFGDHMLSRFKRKSDAISHEKYFGPDSELPLGRYGGDEFAMIVDLGDRDEPDGLSVDQRMGTAREYVTQVTNEFVAAQDEEVRALDFNISIGGAVWRPEAPVSVRELVEQADQSMYATKVANGRPAR